MADRGYHVSKTVEGLPPDMPQYMIVERFHEGAQEKIYQRFHAKGRMLPDGLHYIDSWLSSDTNICFQIMATGNIDLFEEWFQHWNDLTDFDIHPLNNKPG